MERVGGEIGMKEKFKIEKYEGKKPPSKILKLIVADVLESFGFKVKMNKKIKTYIYIKSKNYLSFYQI